MNMRLKRALILSVVFAFAFVLAACQQTTTTTTATTATTTTTTTTATTTTTSTTTTTTSGLQTMSILNGWVDSGDEVHTIVQSASELSVTYDKQGFSWASMVYEIDQDLSVFNKLVLAISGSGTLLVKIQGVDSSFEVSLQLTAGQVSYQLNLRDYDVFLGGVTGVYLFGGPGKAQGTGNFTITQFAFDEGTAYGTVLENGDSNIPTNELEYDGTGETFEFKTGFIDNGDGVYDIDKSGDNPIVTYTKAVGFEWAYMISTVRGSFSDFDFIVLHLKGITAGSVIFKAELSSSVKAEVPGTFAIDEEITIVIDLSSWTDEQMDALTKILIFGAGGSGTAAGEFEIMSAYFAKVSPIETIPMWTAYGATVVEEGSIATVTYADIPSSWWDVNIQSPVENFDGTKTEIIFTFTGVAGTEYKFKIEGGGQNVEGPSVVATGESQEYVLDLSGKTETERAGFNLVVAFITTAGASGTLVLEGWRYVVPAWTAYGATVVVDGTTATVTYADIPATWWDVNIQSPVADFDETKTSIVFTFTGVAGTEYKFKIEGGGQAVEGPSVVATGVSQEYVLDLSGKTEAERAGFNLVVAFITTAGATGTLVIEGWEYVIPAWTAYGATVVMDGSVATVTYADIPSSWWDVNIQSPVADFDETKASIVFTFTGVAGTEYKFKIEGGGQAVEGPSVVATGASQEYVLDLSGKTETERAGFNLVVAFITTAGATGTLVIEGWEYVIPAWTAYGATVVVDGSVATVTYADIPATWWDVNIQSPVADFDETKTSIVFTFTGVVGTEYKFKIEGGGQAVEGPSVVATGVSQEYVLDLSGKTETERAGFNLVVAFITTAGATGNLVIEGWEYVIPAWTAYGMEAVVTDLSVTATYTDTPAAWWSNNLQSPIADFDETKTSIVFTFTGVAGTSYLFKIEGGGQFVEASA
ncbi:MAG: hypothetical protein KKE16_02165, partial [Firmicutes bacterium]|nr:hypothetical protein [Bacillota bacterium]